MDCHLSCHPDSLQPFQCPPIRRDWILADNNQDHANCWSHLARHITTHGCVNRRPTSRNRWKLSCGKLYYDCNRRMPSISRIQLSYPFQSSQTNFPDWRQAAFKSYLLPGAAGKFIAFWECSCRAAYNYTGNEIVGITADETERQRETLPKAVRRVSYRIIFYYVGSILALGLNVSADDPILTTWLSNNATTQPLYPGGFIIMLQRANIAVLPDVVNAVMIIAAISVANADLYVTVRD